MVFLDNPASIFDRGQFSLQTSGSFDNKWFERNGFVVTAMVYIMQPISVETTLSTVVIVEAVKHGIGQVLLGRNAKMADWTVPRGIGTCGTNGRPQRGWGTNVTTDLDLQAHRRMTILVVVMVMIACITRSRINQWSTLISTVFENRPKKSHQRGIK